MGLSRHYESDLLIAYLHAYLLMLNTAKQLVYSSLRTSPSMREIPRSYAHWPIVLPSLNVSAGTSLLWCTPSLLIILCTLMTPTFITSDPTSLNSRLLYPIASSMFNLDAQLTSQTLYVENQT